MSSNSLRLSSKVVAFSTSRSWPTGLPTVLRFRGAYRPDPTVWPGLVCIVLGNTNDYREVQDIETGGFMKVATTTGMPEMTMHVTDVQRHCIAVANLVYTSGLTQRKEFVTRSSRKLSPRIVSYVKEPLSPSDRPKSAHVHTVYAVCT